MKFSLVFHSHETFDLSYGLVYIPGTVWKRGDEELVIMSDERYQMGSITKLLKSSPDIEKYQAPQKECLIIAHQTGHGQLEDYNTLLEDLRGHGYNTTKASFKISEIVEKEEIPRTMTKTQCEMLDILHLGVNPYKMEKFYQERMDLIFGNGRDWHHRSLRTLFDYHSSEYNSTSMVEKVEILRAMIKEGEKIGAIGMEYAAHYVGSGRNDIAGRLSLSVADILDHTLKDGESI
ncbi:MAG: hypothetical protein QNL04_08360 [SAR324 cluster bacterium]|nr:hypothetical protein [SAR324 cluster bacterium]